MKRGACKGRGPSRHFSGLRLRVIARWAKKATLATLS